MLKDEYIYGIIEDELLEYLAVCRTVSAVTAEEGLTRIRELEGYLSFLEFLLENKQELEGILETIASGFEQKDRILEVAQENIERLKARIRQEIEEVMGEIEQIQGGLSHEAKV